MKIRAKANGDVIEIDDDAAKELLDAGIYEPVEPVATKTATPKSPARTPTPPAPKAPTPGTSTKVAPMTTEDMPTTPIKPVK